MRFIQARYEEGSLKPTERLRLRQGEWVNLIVVRQPDLRRWNLERLANSKNEEDVALAEQGLSDWAAKLDEEDRS
jgi:predicted DNA-binding antitoxin AbrB/MazE fold protein